MIALRNGNQHPPLMIDITKIEALRKIDEKNGTLFVGAAVTHSEIASSPPIKKWAKVLSDAASEIGSPQIRNLGTIGGNIVNASPAADTVPPLIVLNSMALIVSKRGEKQIPLHQLFNDPYQTSLKPDELLVGVTFQKLSFQMKSSFVRLARRDAMAIARMSVAVVVEVEEENKKIRNICIAAGSITPTPKRFSEAEDILRGKSPDDENLGTASLKISKMMIERTGIRSSTNYKQPVIKHLFIRAMRKALEE